MSASTSASRHALQASVALVAIVSLAPFFLWHHLKLAYAVAMILLVVAAGISWRELVFSPARLAYSIAFGLFFIYLSFLSKVDGPPTKWYLLMPFVVATLHLAPEDLLGAFSKFHAIFAVSMVPGILLWAWLLAGQPLEMTYTVMPGYLSQRTVTDYGVAPGAIFLLSNSVVLEHGGTLFRLAGCYDEPGSAGTIAALCLAVARYRMDWKGLLCLLAGLLSFSVAFAILTATGLLATGIASRRRWMFSVALLCASVGVLPLVGFQGEVGKPSNIRLTVPADHKHEFAPWLGDASKPLEGQFTPDKRWSLRNTEGLANRDTTPMRDLLFDYVNSPTRVVLFGMGIDASIRRVEGTTAWYRLLTDFGAVGFAWALALFAAPVVTHLHRRTLDAAMLVFVLLFLMNFYQRPLVWMPAQLLIYFAGIRYIAPKHAPVGRPGIDVAA